MSAADQIKSCAPQTLPSAEDHSGHITPDNYRHPDHQHQLSINLGVPMRGLQSWTATTTS